MIKHSRYETEEALFNDFKNGEQSAFNEVFTHFYSGLCFFSTRLVNDRAIAEEVVLDVFYKLWEKHTDFNNLSSLKAFLYISVRNACMNQIDKEQRKNKRMALLSDEEGFDQPVLNAIIYSEVLSEIQREINNLPEQCSKVIKMLYEEDMKPNDIAAELGITVSTVYNQKLKGVALLKKRLSGAGFDLLMIFLALQSYDILKPDQVKATSGIQTECAQTRI